MFTIDKTSGTFGRTGHFTVRGYTVKTPTFMPDGTRGGGKGFDA